MNLSYKYRLYPNQHQMFIDRCIFTFNQAYNAGINLIQSKGKEMYLDGIKGTQIFNTLYSDIKLILEKREITNSALIQDGLRSAYNTLFSNIKQGKSFNLRFKKSSSLEGSFPLRNNFKIKDSKISIFGKKVDIKLHRELPKDYRILGYRIKRENDKYYLIVNLTDDKSIDIIPDSKDDLIGMDTNSGNYVFSSGYKIDFVKSIFPNLELKRKNKQKVLSSKKRGSKNRKKAQKELFNVSRKIKNKRKDELHKRAKEVLNVIKEKIIVLEDLNIKNMTKKNGNKGLTKNLIHQAHNLFFSLLAYKATLLNRSVIRVNPIYTTMTCSRCGSLQEMPLGKKLYSCDCGLNIDRDLNAAINIKRLGTNLYFSE